MSAALPSFPAVLSDPARADAWRRFLDLRVEGVLESFLGDLRGDALNMATAGEAQVRLWQGALAVALVEGKRRGLGREGVLQLFQTAQMVPVADLTRGDGIPAPVIEEGAVLMTRREEFLRGATEVGLGELVTGHEAGADQARALGRERLAAVAADEAHFRALVKEQPVPFRAQVFFDLGEAPSRVLLTFCLLAGFRMPEWVVAFIRRKSPGEGRSSTRSAGLAGSFLRVLPPGDLSPEACLAHHAGHLTYARQRKAYAAAAEAIGLAYIPRRGEILLRLLAAAGEESCLAALRAESEVGPSSMEKPGAFEHLARPRHGAVLHARLKAVERSCQRALEQGEPGTGDSMGVTPLELSMFRCGALLWKSGTDPAKGRPGEATGWRLAGADAEAADDVPPPPFPEAKKPRGRAM